MRVTFSTNMEPIKLPGLGEDPFSDMDIKKDRSISWAFVGRKNLVFRKRAGSKEIFQPPDAPGRVGTIQNSNECNSPLILPVSK